MQVVRKLRERISVGKYLMLGVLALVPYTAGAYDNGQFVITAGRLDAVQSISVDLSSSSSLNPWPTNNSCKYALIQAGGLKGCITLTTSQRKTVGGDTRIFYRKMTSPRP